MKKAFTLSEALITLAILGVLAAILIPVINNVRPDKDKITYKKALYSMQGAISQAMDDATLLSMGAVTNQWGSDPHALPLEGLDSAALCSAVADTLNVAGKVNCGDKPFNCSGYQVPQGSKSCYASPNFITTDGIRYWGLDGTITRGTEKVIYVDRNLSSGELRNLASKRLRGAGGEIHGLKLVVRGDGKVHVPEGDDFAFENELIENSLQVSAGKMN